MAESLAERGHDVTVFASHPFYPDWQYSPGIQARRWTRERLNGVTVHRSPVYLPRKFNAITRMLHYGSFALACLGPVLRAAWANKPDLEIGRAACRERVCQYEYISACGVSLIKKIIT